MPFRCSGPHARYTDKASEYFLVFFFLISSLLLLSFFFLVISFLSLSLSLSLSISLVLLFLLFTLLLLLLLLPSPERGGLGGGSRLERQEQKEYGGARVWLMGEREMKKKKLDVTEKNS